MLKILHRYIRRFIVWIKTPSDEEAERAEKRQLIEGLAFMLAHHPSTGCGSISRGAVPLPQITQEQAQAFLAVLGEAARQRQPNFARQWEHALSFIAANGGFDPSFNPVACWRRVDGAQ